MNIQRNTDNKKHEYVAIIVTIITINIAGQNDVTP